MKKKYKKVGFFKEEGFPKMPSIYDLVKINNPSKRKMPWRKWNYLSRSPMISATTGCSLLDKKFYGSEALVTDGEWVWNTSIIYYYENHGMDLPAEFANYLDGLWIPYPLNFGIRNFISRNRLVEEIDFSLRQDEDLKD